MDKTAGLGLVLAHVRAEQKMFWRNPVAAVFTFAFPLFFLLIFAELSPDGLVASGRFIDRFVPLMSAFGLISACFGNLVIFVCERRERGIFKRRRATPVRAGVGGDGRTDRIGNGDSGRARAAGGAPRTLRIRRCLAVVLSDMLSWSAATGVQLHGLEVTRPSLEDTYLRLVE